LQKFSQTSQQHKHRRTSSFLSVQLITKQNRIRLATIYRILLLYCTRYSWQNRLEQLIISRLRLGGMFARCAGGLFQLRWCTMNLSSSTIQRWPHASYERVEVSEGKTENFHDATTCC